MAPVCCIFVPRLQNWKSLYAVNKVIVAYQDILIDIVEPSFNQQRTQSICHIENLSKKNP